MLSQSLWLSPVALRGKCENRIFCSSFVVLHHEAKSLVLFIYLNGSYVGLVLMLCANPPIEQLWRTLLFKGWEDKFFLSCSILSLVVLFCCAFVTLLQELLRNNTILHFKSLLKHRRSYLCCDNVGLLFCVSWLLINRLFISIGFTTSLISSLLSLTKVFSSTLQEKYFWSKQMGTWLPLLSTCTVCCTLDGWLAVIPASSLPEILYCYISPPWPLEVHVP